MEYPIKRYCTDFNTELRSGPIERWRRERGIEFEPSAPYSQEQNGRAERQGHTLIEMVRATMIAGAIPENLWPEIVLAETLVKNLRPANVLRDKTPWEIRKKTTPDLTFL